MRKLFEIDKKDYPENSELFVRDSSRAIIFKGNLLACVYAKNSEYIKFPGGGIEEGETRIDALLRETLEETGLKIIEESIAEYGIVHRIQKGKDGKTFVQDNYYYTCNVYPEIKAQRLTKSEIQEGFELRWITLDQAVQINQRFVERYPSNTMIERELKVLTILRNERG